MVSVSCLAYNHEKYIRQTLEGFVNQKTNFKFEIMFELKLRYSRYYKRV